MGKNDVRNVVILQIFLLFLIGLIAVIIPTSRNAMFVYLFLGIINLTLYTNSKVDGDFIGFSSKYLVFNIVAGLIFGAIFFAIVKLVPGASIGLPNLPQSIADQVRSFVLFVVAPIFETIFQATLFGVLKKYRVGGFKTGIAFVFMSAVFLSSLHIGAYISGFYNYPSLPAGLQAIGANIGAFLSAFFFFFTSGFFFLSSNFKKLNLIFGFIAHSLVNLIVSFFLAVTFAIG